MDVTRPLDLLNSAKGKRVMVELKNGRHFMGKLIAFDIHPNVVMTDVEEVSEGESKRRIGDMFLRGDTIIFISPAED